MWRSAGFMIVACLLLLVASPGAGGARAAALDIGAWTAYKAKFMGPDGRIVDDGNHGISHSEGQGYGLLLAYLAGQIADFEQIWSFTRTELLVRDDGLAAWSWDPAAKPHVTDINNASDGDLLIAYALALAGRAWNRNDFLEEARRIAQALLDRAVIEQGDRTLLLPGVAGFAAADRKDGPIVNPSYCIFEAFSVLNDLVPSPKWQALNDSCLALLQEAQFGPKLLPAEWVSVMAKPQPAEGYPAEFGYNALRIPLYLVRGNVGDRSLLTRLRDGMTGPGGTVALVDLPACTVEKTLDDPGYLFVYHLVACVIDGTKIAAPVAHFAPTLYYPSTLHLLGLAYIAANHPECL